MKKRQKSTLKSWGLIEEPAEIGEVDRGLKKSEMHQVHQNLSQHSCLTLLRFRLISGTIQNTGFLEFKSHH